MAHDSVKEFAAGGVGGIAGVVAGHPLDTIRIRLQQPRRNGKGGGSTLIMDLLRKEGPSALLRGITSPIATVAFQNALAFQAYGAFARAISPSTPHGTQSTPPTNLQSGSGSGYHDITPIPPLSLPRVALAGIGAGCLQTIITTPVDLVKIRLQIDTRSINSISTQRQFIKYALPSHGGTSTKFPYKTSIPVVLRSGAMEMVYNILQREGVRGLYRGWGVTILRDTPAHATYFSVYEFAKECFHPGCRINGNESLSTMLCAGGIAGALSWVVIYPLDVAKSRLQAQGEKALQVRYNGFVDCLIKSVAEEGLNVLWRGLGVTMCRAFIVNAAIFGAYESTLRCI